MSSIVPREWVAPTPDVYGVPYAPESVTRVAGLDLGQTNDPSAAVVLEYRRTPDDFLGPRTPLAYCLAARRWPTGTDYRVVCDDILYAGVHFIVSDFTGVGRPVVDILRGRAQDLGYQGTIIPAVIVASNAKLRTVYEERGMRWSVPKCDLIGAITTLQQAKRYYFEDGPDTQALLRELAIFQRKQTKTGGLQYGNEAGREKHDDLVIALGLASWWMLQGRGSRRGGVMR